MRRAACATASELALTLDRLMPVGTLDSVDAAVALILEHRERRILVVGDFDADGATSTALIVRCLRAWGFASVDFLVPEPLRVRLRAHARDRRAGRASARRRSSSPSTTASRALPASRRRARAASRCWSPIIICREPSLPDADVIVNPNVPGSRFGSRALAGVGVAFYVMAAVRREIDARGTVVMPPVTDFLDLVALGTVADLVPLDVNNRVLVAQGIRRIRAGRAVPGIRALLDDRQTAASPALTAADLGFTIGPRLNAAGRLDDMSIGIRCLLGGHRSRSAGARHAARSAQCRAPRDRSAHAGRGAGGGERVCATRGEGADAPRRVPVRSRTGTRAWWAWWRAASRIACGARSSRSRATRDGTLRGSARSVPGIHIRDVLDGIAARHPELISRFGGHAMAAGLSLEERHLDAFARAFDDEVARWRDPSIPSNRVETDGELASDEIALETAQALRDGGPWGQAFPEPCFDGSVRDQERARGGRQASQDVGDHGRSVARLRRHRLQLQGQSTRTRRCPTATCAWCTGSTSTNTRASAACSCSSITCCHERIRHDNYTIRDGRSARPARCAR